MKFSRKLIFLAIILIVVSIISMYFGSVKPIEGLKKGMQLDCAATNKPSNCKSGSWFTRANVKICGKADACPVKSS